MEKEVVKVMAKCLTWQITKDRTFDSTRDLLSQVGCGIGFRLILLIVFDD